MRVAVVTGARALDGAGGLEIAEVQLLAALRAQANGTPVALRVVGGRGARRYASVVGGSWCPARPGRASALAWRGADLIHLAGQSVPPPRRTPFVATFHDLSPLHFDDEGELCPWTPEIAARAELCLCISGFTAAELQTHLGVPRERIRVVPMAPGQPVSQRTEPLTDGELAELGLARPLVVRTGGYTTRKNVPLLLRAWAEVGHRTGATLALTGPPHAARDVLLAVTPSLPRVRVFDYLPAALVARLVRTADVLVSPSVYEGFGMPMVEAMAAATPVVAVRTAFAEEVCGDAAVLVPNDAAPFAEAIIRVLEDVDLRERMRAAGAERARAFSWERSAELLVAAYREAAA